MGIFKKKQPEPTVQPGRRRPAVASEKSERPNTAFSYHAQRSYSLENTGRLEASKAAERDSARPTTFAGRHRTVLFGWLGAVTALVAIYCLVLSTQPRIVLLQDETTEYFLQDQSVYRQSVQDVLGTSVFNRNKLTVDTAAIRTGLLQNYPEVKNASVELPLFGHNPQIYIEPYKPSFILTTTAGNAFLLDATGRALATTSQITDIEKLNLLTVQDRSGLAVTLGNRALPGSTVDFVQTVIAALRAKQIEPSALVLPAATSELDVSITGEPYFIKYNLQGDALAQAGTYLATRQRLEKDGIKPVEYVDVRVPERSYYK